MKTEIADRWVEELESGRWYKGTGNLATGDLHCCLGVLCRMAIADGVPVRTYRRVDGRTVFNGEVSILPDAVMFWAGMASGVGVVTTDLGATDLSRMNDYHADWRPVIAAIRKHKDTL